MLQALIAVLSLCPWTAGAYRVFLNINQFPSTMVTEASQWSQLRAGVDGMFGIGAPHPWSPMNPAQRAELIGMFASDRQVLVSKYEYFMGDGASAVSHDNVLAFAASQNFYPTRVFMWPAGGGTLSVQQLNAVRDTGFPLGPIFINVRGWGRNSSTTDGTNRERIVESIMHPWCRGVVIEGNPVALTKPILRLNERLQVAQFVAQQTNKTLLFLQPPIHDLTTATPLVDQVADMLRSLHDTLGADMCTRRVVIVPSAYTDALAGNTSMPFLPETDVTTYAGLALFVVRDGVIRCSVKK